MIGPEVGTSWPGFIKSADSAEPGTFPVTGWELWEQNENGSFAWLPNPSFEISKYSKYGGSIIMLKVLQRNNLMHKNCLSDLNSSARTTDLSR